MNKDKELEDLKKRVTALEGMVVKYEDLPPSLKDEVRDSDPFFNFMRAEIKLDPEALQEIQEDIIAGKRRDK